MPAAWRSRPRTTSSPSTGPDWATSWNASVTSGPTPCPGLVPHAYVELHIEQGPVLDAAGEVIGAVTGVQGISWQELVVSGQANHAGTTPMAYRHDAGFVAASVATFVRRMVNEIGPPQVGTVGRLDLHPDLVNVVADRAAFTVDLRNTDEKQLRSAERRLASYLSEIAAAEGVQVTSRVLARFEPVELRPPHDLAGRGDGQVVRVHGPPAAGRRRPRRSDAGPGVPRRHDLRPERRRHQPQPGRVHTARTPGGRGRHPAADARPPR